MNAVARMAIESANYVRARMPLQSSRIELIREDVSIEGPRDKFAHDPPIAHVQNAVGIVIDLGDLAGDMKDGYALVRQIADKFVDAFRVANVHANGGTVEDQN